MSACSLTFDLAGLTELGTALNTVGQWNFKMLTARSRYPPSFFFLCIKKLIWEDFFFEGGNLMKGGKLQGIVI